MREAACSELGLDKGRVISTDTSKGFQGVHLTYGLKNMRASAYEEKALHGTWLIVTCHLIQVTWGCAWDFKFLNHAHAQTHIALNRNITHV